MQPNKKVEENIPALELDFTLKYKWAAHNFDVEYLTKPYPSCHCGSDLLCGQMPAAPPARVCGFASE